VAADATLLDSAAAGAERDVAWRTLPRNLLQDQKDIWLFPAQLAKGRHWLPTIAVTGVTTALIVADPHDTPYFLRTARFEGFNDARYRGRGNEDGDASAASFRPRAERYILRHLLSQSCVA
jgi:hypothetical protein